MYKWLIVILLLGGIASCTTAPPIQYYVLEPINHNTASMVNRIASNLTVGIGPVTIPGLLDRKKIVTRGPDNTIQIAEFNQWAMPIQDNLTETLVNNLTRLQPDHIFRTYPWSVYGVVDIQVIVDILRFDATSGKSVNLEANWTIKNEKTQALLKTGRSILQQPLTDSSYPSAVRGLSNVLGLFSQELNSELSRLTISAH